MASSSTAPARLGTNLVISSLLALLSYVPFEYVAKITLIVAAGLFILDPIPPLTRLLSVILVAVVSLLSRIERHWRDGQVEAGQDAMTGETLEEHKKTQ